MTGMRRLVDAWYRANARPVRFFGGSADAERPALALVGLMVSGLLASACLAVLMQRSGLPAPAFTWSIIIPALLLPYLALLTAIAALASMRTRGFQPGILAMHAWAWTPAGTIALVALPMGLLDTRVALLGYLLTLPVAHTFVVTHALRVIDPGRWQRSVTEHLILVFAVPAVVTLLPFTLIAGRA